MSERVYETKTKTIVLDSLTNKIKLWCFGDVHRFTKSCDEERWKWFLKSAKETHDSYTYYLGLGDYTDFASTNEHKALIKTAGLHKATIDDFDDMVKKRNRVLAAEMSFMKPNILGLIDGNHGWMFQNGTSSTADLADRLNTEYLGWLCHYTVKVNFSNSLKVACFDIVACHGRAGGKTAGNSVNQLDDMRDIFPVADIYCMGHDHQRLARPVSVLVPSWDGEGNRYMKQKRQFLCRSGSFKKGYAPGTASYEIERLLRPADLGALQLEIGFHRDHTEGDRVILDIKAIL
jgi:hypothetical protein